MRDATGDISPGQLSLRIHKPCCIIEGQNAAACRIWRCLEPEVSYGTVAIDVDRRIDRRVLL